MTGTTTLTLPDFLLARIREDEAAAKFSLAHHWRPQLFNGEYRVIDAEDEEVVCVLPFADMAYQHIARWDPARVLAECAAKRAIVEWHKGSLSGPILRILAAPYADHPDYREDWRP